MWLGDPKKGVVGADFFTGAALKHGVRINC